MILFLLAAIGLSPASLVLEQGQSGQLLLHNYGQESAFFVDSAISVKPALGIVGRNRTIALIVHSDKAANGSVTVSLEGQGGLGIAASSDVLVLGAPSNGIYVTAAVLGLGVCAYLGAKFL